jgi:2-dehydro-3-deoxyphosphooctonate aldolase (KDO 8-P synthase)
VTIGEGHPLVLIAGPCVIEGENVVLETAEKIADIAGKLHVPFIFKSSYLKDNRSRADTFQGPGLQEGLRILEMVKKRYGIPVLSDVHSVADVDAASRVLDVLQIPAYLSQQTSLALAVARTGKPVNVKKGQFVAPEDMIHTVEKIRGCGNDRIMLTERGSCFGYRNLVVDMRSIPIMKRFGCPVVFDVTHAVRVYGTPSSDPSGGQPEFIFPLARAGVAAGCDAIFIETHPRIEEALCDRASMLPLQRLEEILARLKEVSEVLKHSFEGSRNAGLTAQPKRTTDGN